MAFSGTFYPTSNVIMLSGFTPFGPGSSSTWGVAGFTNPGNASADDGVYATSNNANGKMEGHLFLFDFSTVPSNAALQSFLVRVERKYSTTASGAGDCIGVFSSQTGGNPTGMIGAQSGDTSEPTTDNVRTVNFTVNTSQLKGASFCVGYAHDRVSLTAYTGSLDYIRVELTWTIPVASLVHKRRRIWR